MATDGPVTKPRREPIEKPEPRPKGPVNQPPPPPAPAPRPRPAPPPRPRPAPPPPDDPTDRGPFQKPIPPNRQPKEPEPPTTLKGPIGTRWRALGGASWGTPLHEPMNAGRGMFVEFRRPDGSGVAIYHSGQTAASVVWPRMGQAWSRNGWAHGALGLPTADEGVTHDGAGRYQSFQGGVVVWHPSIGSHAVQGTINARYAQLGGTGYGYPITDETLAPDKRGRFNHFRDMATGAEKSIYWTPEHGAHELFGVIRQAWMSYQGGAGLGYPTTGELVAHDKVGRWQIFENCTYVWHPTTGAHEVHGAIRDRYGAIGGSAFGYPTTDETVTPDKRGRFNHFTDVSTGAEKSIYWHPDTGAHEVYGVIRGRWASYGWERGKMGYPKGPEIAWPAGGPGAREQAFQGGRMIYSGEKNVAAPDPVEFFHDFGDAPGPAAFEGWVSTKLYWDGRVENRGRMRATGFESYDFNVQTLLSTDTVALTAGWQAHVGGTDSSDARAEDWRENEPSNALVTANYFDLQHAEYRAERQYSGSITGIVSDIAEWALKFVVGATVLANPGGALLVITVGGLAAAVAKKGDLASGAKIIGGTLWMLGPFGTLYAIAMEGLAAIGHDSRDLRPHEYDLAKLVFGPKTPPKDKVRITDTIGAGDRPFVFPRADGVITINMGPAGYQDALTYKEGVWSERRGRFRIYGEAFIHEMVHAWQLTHGSNLAFITAGMAKVFGESYTYTPGKDYSEYKLEPQSSIVEDWYARNYTKDVADESYGLDSQKAKTDPLFRYIALNARTGKGA